MDKIHNINLVYNKYFNNSTYIFQLVENIWIIIMEKVIDTQTNEKYNKVVNDKFAKFCANKLKIILIFNIYEPEQTTDIIVIIHNKYIYKYIVDEITTIDNYEININNVYSYGIHYYKTFVAALNFSKLSDKCKQYLTTNYTGYNTYWYDNGQIEGYEKYINGQLIELWTYWYHNGQISKHEKYLEGVRTGTATYWYANNIKMAEGEYNEGYKVGVWYYWYDNGNIQAEKEYSKKNILEYEINWYKNGNKKSEGNFYNGEKSRYWVYWYENGQKYKEGEFHKGKQIGKWIQWYGYYNDKMWIEFK